MCYAYIPMITTTLLIKNVQTDILIFILITLLNLFSIIFTFFKLSIERN